MEAIMSLGLGYFIGSINPAALFSRWKHVDLKTNGTGNLGATNTMLLLGKGCGLIVMLLDVAKAILSAHLAQKLFPMLKYAGMLGSLGAMIVHDFSLFLHFKGGKGVAAFGGLLLAYSPAVFLSLFGFGILQVAIFDYGFAGPISAGILFPVVVALRSGDFAEVAIAAVAGLVLVHMHMDNVKKAKNHQETPVRSYLVEKLANLRKQ